MIYLTENAANEVKDIIKEHELDEETAHLRVGLKGGGCSGFNFILDLTQDVDKEKDMVFESNDIKIACDEKSHIYLQGASIDFKDELMGRGFVFEVPYATSKCGCGQSVAF